MLRSLPRPVGDEAILDAAAQGDVQRFQELVTQAEAATRQANRSSAAYGMIECAKDGSNTDV